MGSITRELALQELARRPMGKREEARQRRSFAFGNVSMANPNVTREMIERADREQEIVRMMLTEFGHDPDDVISDAGHTVLDGWMERVRNEIA